MESPAPAEPPVASPASAEPPKPPVPEEVKPGPADAQERRRWLAYTLLVAVVAVVAVLVAPAAVARLHTWWSVGGALPPVVYALTQVVPTKPCIQISMEELASGHALGGSVPLRDIYASLLHHIRHPAPGMPRPAAISAQALERHRVCYAVVNMTYSDAEAENLQVFINPRIVGVSRNAITRTTEWSLLCRSEFEARRFDHILVQYMTPAGVVMERAVDGRPAFLLQQIVSLHAGEAHCEDSNSDAQLHALRQQVDVLAASLDMLVSAAVGASRAPAEPRRLAPGPF